MSLMTPTLTVFDTARRALEFGISVVPPAEDGTKRPLPGAGGEWKEYQEHHPSLDQLSLWYGHRVGIGFVCGRVSGGLELFEFDDRDTYERFKEVAAGLGGAEIIERIEGGYLEETPGGGVHWFYYAREVRGSTKLATRQVGGTRKTLIETKGEGGFVIVAPTAGRVHPSGKPYRLIRGGIDTIAEVTDEEREWLWVLARSFDDAAEPPAHDPAEAKAAEKYRKGTGEWDDTATPGDDYNARVAWADVLDGWAFAYQHGDTQYWRRPGKKIGISATINHNGTNRLHVFTSSTELEPNTSYSKFGVYAKTKHRGDFQAAAKTLYTEGYGTHKRWVKEGPRWVLRVFNNPVPRGEHAAKPGEPPPEVLPNGVVSKTPRKTEPDDFGMMADEDLGLVMAAHIDPEPIFWEWPNRIARGKLNLIAGEGGDGKSQITVALVAAITNGAIFPDGTGPAEQGVCCILSAEDGAKDTIIPRLIAANADRSRVLINTAKVTVKDKDGKSQIHPVSFQDLAYWRVVFERHKVRMLIADPLPAYLGRGVNDHRNNEVRAVLEPFVKLLEDYSVSMVAITHLNKSTDQKNPTHKILGSVAYSNLARVVYGTYKDIEDEGKRYFAMIKVNVAAPQPPLAYRIEPYAFEFGGREIKTSRVAFEAGPCDFSPTAHVAAQSGKTQPGRPATTALKDAEWLFDYLFANGWMPLAAILDTAGECGMLGEKKQDGRYPNVNRIYRAKDKVNALEGDRRGFVVDETKMAFRGVGKLCTHWRLVPEDEPF